MRRQLEEENGKLKKLVADLSLAMRPGRKRKLVDEVRSEWQVSTRRTCAALEFDRRELGQQLRNKTPKRRVKAKLRDDRKPATRSNETWGDGPCP
ncbi:hypothetical protein ACVWW1_008675 [Bradyrhizobium sp. JR3.5]